MSILDTYNYYITEVSDETTRDWLTVKSPLPLCLITFSYLYFVQRCGPNYMKNRPAYSFKGFIQLYNIFQVVANAFTIYQVFESGWYTDTWIYCVPQDTTPSDRTMKVSRIIWWFLILKVIDYTETALFVLRKKQNQITYLHLYHHVSTAYIVWLTLKYLPTSPALFEIVVNAGVHVIMYTYYFMSTCGPRVQRLANGIKPIITIIQMTQLVLLMIHAIQIYLPSCKMPKFIAIISLINLAINLSLFSNFYQKNYVKTKKN